MLLAPVGWFVRLFPWPYYPGICRTWVRGKRDPLKSFHRSRGQAARYSARARTCVKSRVGGKFYSCFWRRLLKRTRQYYGWELRVYIRSTKMITRLDGPKKVYQGYGNNLGSLANSGLGFTCNIWSNSLPPTGPPLLNWLVTRQTQLCLSSVVSEWIVGRAVVVVGIGTSHGVWTVQSNDFLLQLGWKGKQPSVSAAFNKICAWQEPKPCLRAQVHGTFTVELCNLNLNEPRKDTLIVITRKSWKTV